MILLGTGNFNSADLRQVRQIAKASGEEVKRFRV